MQSATVSCEALYQKPWLQTTSTVNRSRRLPARASQVKVSRRERRQQNVPGEFYVDKRCIDCDVCRWMAPQVFVRIDEQSAVYKQPNSEEERLRALQALLACPTSSIHTERAPSDILDVQKTFPLPINEQELPGVYHCGYHSERAYGATSYLIVHPKGNILVDSPRYTERLAYNIEKLGGARYMFLTHKDDIADHDKWSRRLKCDRVFHSLDVEVSTMNVEMQLYGDGPWNIGPDFDLIHTPGHTRALAQVLNSPELATVWVNSAAQRFCMLVLQAIKDSIYWYHLAHNAESRLSIFERYNQDSVATQLSSVQKLLELDFKWILPGHGRRVEFQDVQEKNLALGALLDEKRHS